MKIIIIWFTHDKITLSWTNFNPISSFILILYLWPAGISMQSLHFNQIFSAPIIFVVPIWQSHLCCPPILPSSSGVAIENSARGEKPTAAPLGLQLSDFFYLSTFSFVTHSYRLNFFIISYFSAPLWPLWRPLKAPEAAASPRYATASSQMM